MMVRLINFRHRSTSNDSNRNAQKENKIALNKQPAVKIRFADELCKRIPAGTKYGCKKIISALTGPIPTNFPFVVLNSPYAVPDPIV